jgi:hypothetical protein
MTPAVSFGQMPRKKLAQPDKAKRHQVSFRFEEAFIDRIERFADSNPLRPTVTRIIELAVTEWLDKHEPADKRAAK